MTYRGEMKTEQWSLQIKIVNGDDFEKPLMEVRNDRGWMQLLPRMAGGDPYVLERVDYCPADKEVIIYISELL